jgi:hypothetical protein
MEPMMNRDDMALIRVNTDVPILGGVTRFAIGEQVKGTGYIVTNIRIEWDRVLVEVGANHKIIDLPLNMCILEWL